MVALRYDPAARRTLVRPAGQRVLMHTTQLALDGLRLIELDVHGDERGFFIERFNLEKFQTEGLPSAFVQDNHSRSLPGVVRGLHYQHTPPQGKLVGVMRGLIWDVVVDIRPGSATFGESCSVELSDMNGRLLWVPPGFAHGFCVLDDTPADLLYKVDTPYNPDGEAGILWSDQTLNIPWPIRDPIVSTRDQAMPTFAAHRLSHAM
jgi:dTDP-4-dehydrorhamnose 3,5-epimerase